MLSSKVRKHLAKAARRSTPKSVFFPIEPLEERQLLSCAIDLRVAGGGKTAEVTSAGQVVNLEVWAVVTGSNGDGSDDGFESVNGSFISTSSSGSSVLGNMTSTVLSPFTASGAQSGQQADLDGDGDLDIGTNDFNNFPAFFYARGNGVVTSGGVVSGGTHSFEIGTIAFTVTNVKGGQPTDIHFVERGDDSFTGGALWQEDGNFKDANSGSYSTGPSVVIEDANIQTQTFAISGQVYNDANKNGTQNSGENGLSAIPVYLDLNNNGSHDTNEPEVATDANGLYSFTGLSSGAYIVRQALPSGDTQTAPSSNGGQHVTISSANVSGINFGDSVTAVSTGQTVSGLVYNDANSNGKQDSGEAGIAGVTVYLDANNDSSLDNGELSTTTDANGNYSFANVAPGAYIARQILSGGDKQVTPTSGMGQHITVTSGNNVTGANFGDTVPVVATGQSISGEVYHDTNSNSKLDSGETGIAGVTVYIDSNNNSVLDSGDRSTVTDGNGNYSFANVAAGAYIVRQILPSGDKQITPSGGLGQHITVTSGKNVTGANFGDSVPVVSTGFTLSGEVYHDTNSNGKLDSGEAGIAGVTVYIDSNNSGGYNSGEPTTVTDANGNYSFPNLKAGSYIVRQTLPSGDKQITPSGGLGQHVTIGSANVGSVNFGDSTAVAATVSITGEVFKDTNGNGKLDSGETGISGVTVYLDLNNNGVEDSSDPRTTTNSSGVYSFTNLAAGNYIVRQILPSGYKQVTPTSNMGNHVTVASGKTSSGANFADQSTAKTAIAFSESLISDLDLLAL